jgi:ACR3 family arsenite efflux pump ArsB
MFPESRGAATLRPGQLVAGAFPAVAVGLGLAYAAFWGGLATPIPFTRAVLAFGVLCPLAMGQRAARIGETMLRPRARLVPLLGSFVLGPALALVLGRCLLPNHPEQVEALLLLSLLPGSALAPIWAGGTRSGRSTALALSLLSWTIVACVGLPILAGSLARDAGLVVLRDLALLGVMPLAVGMGSRVALRDAFGQKGYAGSVEPIRKTVQQASLTVLLFTSMASDKVAFTIGGLRENLSALAAVLFLYLGLVVGGWWMLNTLRPSLSPAVARATLLVAVTRQTALTMSLLPLVVAPASLPSALVVPLFGLTLELVFGTAALAIARSDSRVSGLNKAGVRARGPSIVPE